MKKIVNFAMVMFAIVVVGCHKPDHSGIAYLDVTPNNIAGVWRMESYDNGAKLPEGGYYVQSVPLLLTTTSEVWVRTRVRVDMIL